MEFVTLDGEAPTRLSAFGTLDGWIGVGLVNMETTGSSLLRNLLIVG